MEAQVPARRPVEDVLADIAALDLDPIKIKLMDEREGMGLSREEADLIEVEYKRFLSLMYKYPSKTIVCSTEVDKFWHQHILDTRKYAEECDRIFGFFIHHFPYFGMRGDEDAANLRNCFEESNQLYEKEFGEAPKTLASAAGNCNVCGSDSCSHSGFCNTCSGELTGASPVQSSIRPSFS